MKNWRTTDHWWPAGHWQVVSISAHSRPDAGLDSVLHSRSPG